MSKRKPTAQDWANATHVIPFTGEKEDRARVLACHLILAESTEERQRLVKSELTEPADFINSGRFFGVVVGEIFGLADQILGALDPEGRERVRDAIRNSLTRAEFNLITRQLEGITDAPR